MALNFTCSFLSVFFFNCLPQYWLSPFSWSIRSIAQSEFFSPRYDERIAVTNADSDGGAGAGAMNVRRGDAYLEAYQMSTDSAYQWAGVGLLLGYYIGLSLLAAWLLSGKRRWLSIGTQRSHSTIHTSIGSAPHSVVRPTNVDSHHASSHSLPASVSPSPSDVTLRNTSSSQSSALPLTRRTLQWSNVSYFVRSSDHHIEKQLLNSIDGECQAGTLTALMGSSGAGTIQ